MWFKNLRIYTLADDFVVPENIEQRLQDNAFRPCGRQELASFGWASPFGAHSEVLCHQISSSYLFCARKEEKVLPAAVVNAELDEAIVQIEAEQGRKVGGKEKQNLKEDIVHRLMPQAFTRFRSTWGMLDTELNIVVVDASAANRAEDFLGMLRSSFSSLPVKPLFSENPSELYFTQWLKAGRAPGQFELGDEVELRDSAEEGGIVRLRQHALTGTEIETHLAHGKQATKIGLNWNERVSFVLEHDLAVKRFKPTDILLDDQDKLVDATPEQKIDADFALLAGEIHAFYPQLVGLFTESN
ncbi:recombination-associated protein RdgC [Pseudidiomarina woesei]|uniref:Recombination-associated protein RdgC n=1 Tax=Pseudidiomarina woesei TaxID=1381080 RepID=A0A0K6HA23_9GAMM|nr:recombination-associated protein RdgC [Pseudidiomarina woesei]CUA87746.1 DNA recombination-dependent growth factor C [Pseudidiomarina woesei]